MIEEEGAQNAGHDDDEYGAEDEKEILVKVNLVLGVDDGSLLSAGVCPHNRMIFHFQQFLSVFLGSCHRSRLKCCDQH